MTYHPEQLYDDGFVDGDDVAKMIEESWDELSQKLRELGFHIPSQDDPANDWCSAALKDGRRCVNDAVKDGLCKRHWRERESEHLEQGSDGTWKRRKTRWAR